MSNSGIDNLKIIVDKDTQESLDSDSQKLQLNSSTQKSLDNKTPSKSITYSQNGDFKDINKFFIDYY